MLFRSFAPSSFLQALQRALSAPWQAEAPLSLDVELEGVLLRVQGRGLTLVAMTAEELRIGGHIDTLSWVRP